MNNESRENEYINIRSKLDRINESVIKIELQCFNNKSNTKKLIEIVKDEILNLSKSIEELKDPFLLFIIGPGKYGKTTLINSLIQDKLLEINDIPNTWKIDVIEGSKEEKIKIYYNDNSNEILPYTEGIEILKQEEIKYKNSKYNIKKSFDEYKSEGKKTIEQLKEYKEFLEKNHIYKSNIEEVRYFINKGGVLNNFIIVDTPGLNQTLTQNTKLRMSQYYKRADGIIWLLDAQNIVSKCSNDLIKELKEDYMIEEDINNIICVVNKIDIIKNKQNKYELEKVTQKTNELYKNHFKDIVLISSKEALDGHLNKDYKLIKSSNINKLNESIDINFKIQSEKLQIRAKYNALKIASKHINKKLEYYKRQLYCDLQKYEESKRVLSEEVEKVKLYTINHVNRYININTLKGSDIEAELKMLELNINNELKKFKLSMETISNISQEYEVIKEYTDINIVKSKELICVYKNMDKLQVENIKKKNTIGFCREFLSKDKNNDIEWTLRFKIEDFRKNIVNVINQKLLEIKYEVDIVRESSFRNKYTDYNLIQEHIKLVNDISNNTKSWG